MNDSILSQSALHWTGLLSRPGTLTNDAEKGKFTNQQPEQKDQATITRDDVAKALLFAINNPPKESTITELFNGNKSISEVLPS